jgi:hypothetical protein
MTTVALAPAALSTRRTWYGSVGAVFAGLIANAVLSRLGAPLLRLRQSPALS